jgi:hypothetical protein
MNFGAAQSCIVSASQPCLWLACNPREKDLQKVYVFICRYMLETPLNLAIVVAVLLLHAAAGEASPPPRVILLWQKLWWLVMCVWGTPKPAAEGSDQIVLQGLNGFFTLSLHCCKQFFRVWMDSFIFAVLPEWYKRNGCVALYLRMHLLQLLQASDHCILTWNCLFRSIICTNSVIKMDIWKQMKAEWDGISPHQRRKQPDFSFVKPKIDLWQVERHGATCSIEYVSRPCPLSPFDSSHDELQLSLSLLHKAYALSSPSCSKPKKEKSMFENKKNILIFIDLHACRSMQARQFFQGAGQAWAWLQYRQHANIGHHGGDLS